MSFIIYAEYDIDLSCPVSLDSKMFCNYQCEYEGHVGNYKNILADLEKHLPINLKPLLTIAGQDYSIEEFNDLCKNIMVGSSMEERTRYINEEYARYHNDNLAAWQSTNDFIDFATSLANMLGKNSSIYSNLDISETYFTTGGFIKDILTIREMTEWGKRNGAQRMRLKVA